MPTIVGILLIILFFYFIHFWQIYLDIFYPVVLGCQDIFLFLGAFMFLDDPIQYHVKNLYELFYKRKEEEEEYRYFLIREYQKKIKQREYLKQYRLKNKEKIREYQREYRIKHKPKKQEVN